MAKNTDKPLYDENGRWVEERGRIKGAIRRAFRLSPQMKETMQGARVELPPVLLKNGKPGKRPRVRYKCNYCGELWSQKNVNVDHIQTVVPLWKKEEDMTYDEIVRGVFCGKENLQVLCSIAMKRNDGNPSCHKIKTDEENHIRRKWKAMAVEKGMETWDWNMDKAGHWRHVMETETSWLSEYRQEKKEKEAKKNERRKRTSKKRKGNPKKD